MRAIIAAAGASNRWANHRGHRKHLVEIGGETLVTRMVRLLRENGVEDIYMTCHPDFVYDVPGVKSIPTPFLNANNTVARLATRHLWATDDRTLILLGDVYFTEEAMRIMTRDDYQGWTHFARLRSSEATGKPGPEMFGCSFGPEDHEAYVTGLKNAGEDTDWPAYCSMTGHPDTPPEDIRDWGMHVEIPDDGTDDFDFPQDYYRFLAHQPQGALEITSGRRVRAEDFDAPWFVERRKELSLKTTLHRKIWENCVVGQVYHERLRFGGRVLGFGVGRERLPAYFACHGAEVMATDRPEPGVWLERQHASGLDELTIENFLQRELFEQYVSYLPVDMRRVHHQRLLTEYDFTWSLSCLEHLGSIDAGLDFFCQQMKCLKPGGIAAHTTELTISGERLKDENLVTFNRNDFAMLGARLASQGDQLLPIDYIPGFLPADQHIDRAPYGLPHLSLKLGGTVLTSVLLLAVKG